MDRGDLGLRGKQAERSCSPAFRTAKQAPAKQESLESQLEKKEEAKPEEKEEPKKKPKKSKIKKEE